MLDPNGSLRQSPPPVNHSLIPTGAIATPPESTHNSSDDEENSKSKGSGRQLENLEELQAAIRIIEQHRASSPTRASEEQKKAKIALELIVPQLKTLHLQAVDANTHDPNRLPLSKEARKILHSRSSTESSILADMARQTESPSRISDDSSGDEGQDGVIRGKPTMLRKKSGELVRPALRPATAKRRPSSMPGTPTYSKAVHFDSHLEHVRHFLQVDKPLAVSAGSSPVESYESEIEFPFDSEESQRSKGSLYEWEIRLSNFPADTPERKVNPVYVERIFLSSDNKNLVGVVSVENLAFGKHVTARFTLDYWKTTSEVVAEYNNDVRRVQVNDGRDRFNFTVKLADLANLENKTMSLCVRYNVDGREFWDSNNSMNYQVDFAKKAKLQHGKNGMPGLAARPLNALPRSRPSPVPGRPKVPVSFDDFSTGTFDTFKSYNQSPAKLMGESPIRLKKKSSNEILPDAPTRRTNAAGGQAFSNRYDFGASLSAAISAASTVLGDRSGLTPKEQKLESKQTYREVASTSKVPIGPIAGRYTAPTPTTTPTQKAPGTTQTVAATGVNSRGRVQGAKEVPGAKAPVPGLATAKGVPLFGDRPLSTSSYQELVDKYCFFGSAKTSPQLTKPTLAQMDGANDDSTSVSDVNIGSVKTSSLGTASSTREASPAPQEKKPSPSTSISPRLPRSTSPTPATGSGLGSRSTSPISFGYPFHQPMQNGLFSESSTPTATYG